MTALPKPSKACARSSGLTTPSLLSPTKGLAALAIEWDDGPHARLSTANIASELEQATLGSGAVAQNVGDVDKALASAVTKVEAIYQVPFLAHATMEPMNCTVHVRPDGCEVWVGSQAIARVQAAAAKVTGLPLDKVAVHNHLIGGGFGRRLESDGVARAVEIAKEVDGPVKVVWTREEDIQHDMYRPYWFDRISAGLDKDGRPIAWKNRYAGSSVIARWLPPAFKNALDPDSTEGAGRGVSLQFVFGTRRTRTVPFVETSTSATCVVCAVDCGAVVNPDTVQAQIQSGIIFGATAALYGEISLKNGRVEQTNFDSYQVIRMNEAPAIEVHIVQSLEPPGGMGETGTSAIVPAIANAIFAATGKRLRKMPVDVSGLKQPA
jgi:CO/xanthine dehydrogenase Mo-binding subunit